MTTIESNAAERTDTLAINVLRWTFVLLFGAFGAHKFLAYEAELIEPMAASHPLLSWLYPAFGTQGASIAIGSVELTTGLLLALGAWFRRASMAGALLAMGTFATTVSIMLTNAPLAIQDGYGPPWLSFEGQFLSKDMVLFAVALAIFLDAHARGKRSA